MSLTDSAVRTFLRSEVQAELYSVPPRYFLGVTEDMFRGKDGNLKPRWQIMLDQVLALPRDKQGNLPQVGTFTQASFEPHAAQLRQTASMFAAATSLPPDSMGVLTDNQARPKRSTRPSRNSASTPKAANAASAQHGNASSPPPPASPATARPSRCPANGATRQRQAAPPQRMRP